MYRTLLIPFACLALGADFATVDPNVFPPDDPRTKTLAATMPRDAQRRQQEANLRETKAFAAIKTKADWEKHRDARIEKLRVSLGTFPDVPRRLPLKVTRQISGEGFVIHNLVFETRTGFWASANLYLPAVPPAKMPGIIISHSHHTPKTQGELQDMGMTWSRAGVAVLVPDHLGHGERRQHDFKTEKDYPKPFRVGRQDYFFRYNSNLQLAAAGESLMGWLAWDLMRGVDVLLSQSTIDRDRIIMLGAVAGGGDPAGVTAALDPRIACVVPFNFGGVQPESVVHANPDRDFDWFGDGYWESTRGLKDGARDGFAHFDIVGAVAPRKLIYAHEFAWNEKTDPAYPRLQKIFGLYDAKDSLRVAHGSGSLKGQPPESSHCTHIGEVHRRMIYPALRDWFGMAIPKEYSQRRPTAELMCWTDAAVKELKPQPLHAVLARQAEASSETVKKRLATMTPAERLATQRQSWGMLLGEFAPGAMTKVHAGKSEEVPGGTLSRYAVEVEPGMMVPTLLITPAAAKGKVPVVVMVSSAGKRAFLKERGDVIATFLKAGVAVCLPDVRGTGETRVGTSSERGSSRTSISQTNLILGQPVLGSQLRDLRSVIAWLRVHEAIDGKRLALWGDSFAKVNDGENLNFAVPYDVSDAPAIAEPAGGLLVQLAALFESDVKDTVVRGGLPRYRDLYAGPYLYFPHDAILPGAISAGDLDSLPAAAALRKSDTNSWVDRNNRTVAKPLDSATAATRLVEAIKADDR